MTIAGGLESRLQRRSEVDGCLAQPPSTLAPSHATGYVNFKKPGYATDSELTDDDGTVRYEDDAVVGLTILHASRG